MAKSSTSYQCSSCGASSIRWLGRCAKCGEFGTVDEVVPQQTSAAGLKASTAGSAPRSPATPICDVGDSDAAERIRTGVGEFDRVIGGGLVPGQVMLLSGEPGAGKSTLLLMVADSLARTPGAEVLYLSGEESVQQIAVRARRIGADCASVLVADDTDLAHVIGHIDAHPSAAMVIVDSVQTVASADIEGRAGGVSQVMAVAQALTRLAKSRGIPVILVGQVTKDSNVAGPRALEHIVDTTISLDGDRHTSLRLLRTVKNRYGSLEVAAFEQTDTGMSEVRDPSVLFRGERESPVPGTCITVTMEGNRALLAEVQALVTPSPSPNPRRAVNGLDSARSAMLIAVTERASGVKLHAQDVFLATVGGIRLSDPVADLATCLALLSACGEGASPLNLAILGEVTLTGDVRPVPQLAQRVAEAFRLGYSTLLVPPGTARRVNGQATGARLIEVSTLIEAIAAFGSLNPRRPIPLLAQREASR